MPDELKKLRGEHCLNIFVSYELKKRIVELAERYDRTMADMVRALIKVGLPVMEGITKAEEEMLSEYVRLFRKMRKMREIKDI
jgi:predicted DNA-binding protein